MSLIKCEFCCRSSKPEEFKVEHVLYDSYEDIVDAPLAAYCQICGVPNLDQDFLLKLEGMQAIVAFKDKIIHMLDTTGAPEIVSREIRHLCNEIVKSRYG